MIFIKTNQLIITIIIVIVVAVGAFYGGMKYQQKGSMPANFAQNGQRLMYRNGGAGGNNRFGGAFGGAVLGQIVSTDQNSITVKLADGSSKIVNLADNTTYNKSETASKSDLTAGTKVAVIGSTNSDGSVTAKSIEINPINRMVTPMPSK